MMFLSIPFSVARTERTFDAGVELFWPCFLVDYFFLLF